MAANTDHHPEDQDPGERAAVGGGDGESALNGTNR
jgi:hypothetical protein